MSKSEIRIWIEEHRQEFIEDMMAFFRIRSVSEPQEGPYPFGEGCARMLDAALSMSERYGFDTQNHEYYCGSALMPGTGKGELGVFTHVDVVDEGEGWASGPYDPVIRNGWIYARGSSDNKGPAVASLYALRYLKEKGIRLKHTVRLYYGCSEENGMDDIEYYRTHYPIPDFSIVPDASFAVCYAEKGILEAKFIRKQAGNVLSFKAGHANNAVPAAAEAILTGVSLDEAKAALAGWTDVTAEETRLPDQTKAVKLSATGKTAHAAFPEGSESAAVKLAACLLESGLAKESSKKCLRFVKEAFEGCHGAGMGAAYEDELSGKLTLIGGMAGTEDGCFWQTMNIRYPASMDQDKLIRTVRDTAERYGWTVESMKNNASHAVDPTDPKIQRLCQISDEVWQRHFEPYAMGGGTYARKLPNAVAYGPGILDQKKPGWPDHGKGHQPDECVCIENMMKAMEIYTLALIALDEMTGENDETD